ncbi:ATP synthase mitochondrial F1 complex assembly factor 1-like [Juglans microcarpa x Juglans regia]|uniref:ATP synthase mitochondrial F1 complex assembly factor 1-like n=1 Tax=Juglans microcarpa x Juglans regia TaxID=2249226 RepID=UPI001B7F1910|nr:ATP synthase mitochondrial F1 complex assembly factor 1-like [Juglans microcarpa x Juglans regia]
MTKRTEKTQRYFENRNFFFSTTLLSHASTACVFPKHFFSALSLQENLQKLQKRALPGGFVKWGSLGFCRTSRFATRFTPFQPKPLDSIMDVERVKDRSPEDITSIWDDYHLGRSHIGASMRANLYYLLEQRAADCPYLVIPLWRGSGYTTMFAQVQMPHIIFTGLEDYKARGTQAAPCVTVSYYKEFAERKGLVLIRGDVVFTSKLSDTEAKWLLETAESFYLNDARYKLVEQFNKKTHDFEFKDVLQALDMPIL